MAIRQAGEQIRYPYFTYISRARRFIFCRAIMSGGVGNYALESDTLSAHWAPKLNLPRLIQAPKHKSVLLLVYLLCVREGQ